jgi:formyltetrahydrofolate deformylase
MSMASVASSGITNTSNKQIAILRIEGPDQKGVVAAYSQTLYGHGCNIIHAEQHTDQDKFFQRIEFEYASADRSLLDAGIQAVSRRFEMNAVTNWKDTTKKVWCVPYVYVSAV